MTACECGSKRWKMIREAVQLDEFDAIDIYECRRCYTWKALTRVKVAYTKARHA